MYREIEIFRAVMLTGSTSRAAEKLDISQPAVSQAIRKLEENAGLKLFARVRGRLLPTQEATALMVDVDQHFIGMEAIAHRLRSLSELGLGRLTIAAYPALGNLFLPRAIASFDLEQRNIQISLKVLSSREVYQQVMAGQVDFGLMADEIPPGGLEHSPFLKAEGVVVMAKNHPLAQRKIIHPADLARTDFLALSPEDSSQQQLNRLMEHLGLSLPVRVETPYSLTICEMARLGSGVGLVNPIVAWDFMHTDLVIRPFSSVVNFAGLMIFRPGKPLSENAREFMRTLRIQLDKDMRAMRQHMARA
ncbi:LysR family transcriptional regulator [Izhakiella australiensis]|uniref:LysR family transcriptional regulator n=1 Tax=Izhakiella australiensis TaxID=1926881 RepID=A0A1S8YTH5_9GAMM|nr:LysR substrate-binding domain-containing protein [Izhakiella australiensis]OON42132.1 LysR family transcriptional regulator [Izhakiella australiensis]